MVGRSPWAGLLEGRQNRGVFFVEKKNKEKLKIFPKNCRETFQETFLLNFWVMGMDGR